MFGIFETGIEIYPGAKIDRRECYRLYLLLSDPYGGDYR